MKKVLVAIYDKVAQKINDPFTADNFETAKRTVRQTLVNSPGLRCMAADLELRELGVIDFVDGVIDVNMHLFDKPVSLVDLLNDVVVTTDDLENTEGQAETK